MNTDHLVEMANRIGEFFEAMPSRDEARDGVAGHIRRYWEPRMRAALEARVAQDSAGLSPLVAEALSVPGAFGPLPGAPAPLARRQGTEPGEGAAAGAVQPP